MIKSCRKFVFLPFLLSSILLVLTHSNALADMRLSSGDYWVVVASRTNVPAAIDVARDVERHLAPTMVVQTRNGVFAVISGYLDAEKAPYNMETLKKLRLLPPDAFLSEGENFVSLAWPQRIRGEDLIRSNTLRNTVVFLQTRLQRLGYYQSEIDGLVGAGMRKAQATFEANHGRYGHRVEGWSATQVITAISEKSSPRALQAQSEQRDRDTAVLRDREERQRRERLEVQASQEGYESALEMQSAEAKGFSNPTDYRAARAGNFQNASEFVAAKQAGFTNLTEVEAARANGFTKAEEYRAFVQSGFADPLEYEKARRQGYSDRTSAITSERRKLVELQDETRVLMEDAALFVRMRPDPARALAIADRIAGITSVMKAEIEDTFDGLSVAHSVLEDQAEVLASYLSKTPDFIAFRREQEDARNAKVKAQIQEVRTRIGDLDRGIKGWMVQNLLDPRMPDMKFLVEQITQNNTTNDLAELNLLVRQIETSIQSAMLLDDIQRLGMSASKDEATLIAREQDQSGIASVFTPTAATRFLLVGDDDDIVLVYNARRAPHIVRDLAGQLRFDGERANLCNIGLVPSQVSERVLRQVFASLERPAQLDLTEGCSISSLRDTDLIAVQRSAFLSGDKAFAQTLIEAVEEKAWRPYDDVTGETLAATTQLERKLISLIETGLAAGTGDGFAAIIFNQIGDQDERDLCLAGQPGTIDTDFHSQQLDSAIGALALPMMDSRTVMSPEDSFIATQRGRCRVIYAAFDDLSRLANAFEADGRTFAVAPFRVEQSELDQHLAATAAAIEAAEQTDADKNAARKVLEAQRAARLEAERIAQTKEAARLKAEQDLADQRSAIAAASAETQTARLRSENKTRASARQTTIRSMTEAIFGGVKSTQYQDAIRYFPDLLTFDRKRKSELWTHVSLKTKIEEYGAGTWEGRNVDAAVVRVEPTMINKELGRNETPCFLLAVLFDDEFDRLRAVNEVSCDAADSIELWIKAHEVQSRWNAKLDVISNN